MILQIHKDNNNHVFLILILPHIFPLFLQSALEILKIIDPLTPPPPPFPSAVPDSSAFGRDGDGCRAWGGAGGADGGDVDGDEGGPGGSGAADREPRQGCCSGAREVLRTERRAGGDTCQPLWCRRCPLRCRCPSLPVCRWSPETGKDEDAGMRRPGAQQRRTSRYLGADGRSGRVQQSLHSVFTAQEAVDWAPVAIAALGPPSQSSQQSGGPGNLAAKLLLQGGQPDQVLQRGRGGTLGPGVDGAAVNIPLRARADAGGEAVGDGEREGDGGRGGREGRGARGRRVGVAECRRGWQRVVRTGAQAGVLGGVAGVWGAGGVLRGPRFGIGTWRRQRRRVGFHLKLEKVKIIQVFHCQRAGGQGGHG